MIVPSAAVSPTRNTPQMSENQEQRTKTPECNLLQGMILAVSQTQSKERKKKKLQRK
jgi:hypothetical protein